MRVTLGPLLIRLHVTSTTTFFRFRAHAVHLQNFLQCDWLLRLFVYVYPCLCTFVYDFLISDFHGRFDSEHSTQEACLECFHTDGCEMSLNLLDFYLPIRSRPLYTRATLNSCASSPVQYRILLCVVLEEEDFNNVVIAGSSVCN